MSRIDALVARDCPDGVVYRTIGEVAGYSTTRLDAADLDEFSFVGVDNLLPNKAGRVNATHTPNTDRLTAYQEGDVLLGNIRPYLKKVWLADGGGGCSGDVLAIRLRPGSGLLPEFLYYLLSSDPFFAYVMQRAKGAKMPRGDKAAIMQFRVPVPPVVIQREIVAILDAFTELQAELEAELEARRTQFYWYRDELLRFDTTAERQVAPFGRLATIVRGGSPRPIQAFLTKDVDGVNWIKIGDVPAEGKYVTSTAQRIRPEGVRRSRSVGPGDFILSNSMSFGRPYIVKIDGCIHDGWLAIQDFEASFDANYLYHLLRSSQVAKTLAMQAGSGTVQNLNADIVKGLQLPRVPLEEQRRVAEVLDAFEALVGDIRVGLPAELVARRKQYEYYRDRLLTFPEAS